MAATNSLYQTETWTDADGVEHDLDTMDPDHRSNLIGFLRRNASGLQNAEYMRVMFSFPDDPSDGVFSAMCQIEAEFDIAPEEWIASMPLMKRLVELDANRTRAQRAKTAVRNKAYELRTGYRKKVFQ